MQLEEAIRRRHMCRSFLDRPVDAAVVNRLVDQARRAPAAGGTQGRAWLVLEGTEQTGRFWAADADADWLRAPSLPGLLNAPVILVPFSDPLAYRARYGDADKAGAGRPGGTAATTPEDDWPLPWWDIDLSFSIMSMLLAAVAEGLGALFFALHGDIDVLRSTFAVPAQWRTLGAIAIGWPAPDASAVSSKSPIRQTLHEVVHRGRW